MSAYIVSDKTINVIIDWVATHSQFDSHLYLSRDEVFNLRDRRDLQRLAEILKAENQRSVNYRYGEDLPVDSITFQRSPFRRMTAVEILKLCDCYSYQACECEDWPETRACRILDRIRDRAIYQLPGYDEAPWGIDE